MAVKLEPLHALAACGTCGAEPQSEQLMSSDKRFRPIYRVHCLACDDTFPRILHWVGEQGLAELAWNAYSTDQKGQESIRVGNGWRFADNWLMFENRKAEIFKALGRENDGS